MRQKSVTIYKKWHCKPVSYTHLDVYKRQVSNYILSLIHILFVIIGDLDTDRHVIHIFLIGIQKTSLHKRV